MKFKRRASAALPRALALVGTLLLIGAAPSAGCDRFTQFNDVSPQRLVYHTDHAAVLRACQEVLTDPKAAGFPTPKDGYTMVEGSQSGAKPPAALSSALKDLNFEFMMVERDHVSIYFGGGFGHWGYDTVRPQGDLNVELIPGLWFWSERSLPRDLSKFPYYRTSKRMLLGGAVMLGISIVMSIYSRRRAIASSAPQSTP